MKRFHISVNGQSYDVTVEEVGAGAPAPAPVAAPAAAPAAVPTPAAAPVPAAPAEGTQVKSPMPGTIVSVDVNVGDSVNEALDSYERALKQSDADANIGSGETGKTLSLEGTVLRIAQEVSGDGGTTYSMLIKEKPNLIFRAPSELSAELVLTQPGDRVSMEFPDTKDSTVVLSSFDKLEISQLPATETSSSVSSSDNRKVSSDRPASSQ